MRLSGRRVVSQLWLGRVKRAGIDWHRPVAFSLGQVRILWGRHLGSWGRCPSHRPPLQAPRRKLISSALSLAAAKALARQMAHPPLQELPFQVIPLHARPWGHMRAEGQLWRMHTRRLPTTPPAAAAAGQPGEGGAPADAGGAARPAAAGLRRGVGAQGRPPRHPKHHQAVAAHQAGHGEPPPTRKPQLL
jgi:hypothetical protein